MLTLKIYPSVEFLVFSSQTHFIKKSLSETFFCVLYWTPNQSLFAYPYSQPPCTAFSTKETKGLYPNHRELLSLCWEVWGTLSCGSWPLYSTTTPRFHLRPEHIGETRAFLSFILSFSSPPPATGGDGHMAGTLHGFSNNRRDLISIPTSCHRWLLGYFVLARLRMWFEFAIRTELSGVPFLPLEPSVR